MCNSAVFFSLIAFSFWSAGIDRDYVEDELKTESQFLFGKVSYGAFMYSISWLTARTYRYQYKINFNFTTTINKYKIIQGQFIECVTKLVENP